MSAIRLTQSCLLSLLLLGIGLPAFALDDCYPFCDPPDIPGDDDPDLEEIATPLVYTKSAVRSSNEYAVVGGQPSITFTFMDKSGAPGQLGETSHQVERLRYDPVTGDADSWEVVQNYGAMSGWNNLVEYVDTDVTEDTTYCYRARAIRNDASKVTSRHCAHTIYQGFNPLLLRAEVILRVGSNGGGHEGTEDIIRARIDTDAARTYSGIDTAFLGHTKPSGSTQHLQTGQTYRFDLNFFSSSVGGTSAIYLSDLVGLRFFKNGSDGVCIRSVGLIVNGIELLTKNFSAGSRDCTFFDPATGYTPFLALTQNDLRDSPTWLLARENVLVKHTPGNQCAFRLPLFLQNKEDLDCAWPFRHWEDRSSLERRIQSVIASEIGKESAAKDVFFKGHPITLIDAQPYGNGIRVHLDGDLEYEINNFFNPSVDLDADLEVQAQCYDPDMNPYNVPYPEGSMLNVTLNASNIEVDVSTFFDVAAWLLDKLDTIIEVLTLGAGDLGDFNIPSFNDAFKSFNVPYICEGAMSTPVGLDLAFQETDLVPWIFAEEAGHDQFDEQVFGGPNFNEAQTNFAVKLGANPEQIELIARSALSSYPYFENVLPEGQQADLEVKLLKNGNRTDSGDIPFIVKITNKGPLTAENIRLVVDAPSPIDGIILSNGHASALCSTRMDRFSGGYEAVCNIDELEGLSLIDVIIGETEFSESAIELEMVALDPEGENAKTFTAAVQSQVTADHNDSNNTHSKELGGSLGLFMLSLMGVWLHRNRRHGGIDS